MAMSLSSASPTLRLERQSTLLRGSLRVGAAGPARTGCDDGPLEQCRPWLRNNHGHGRRVHEGPPNIWMQRAWNSFEVRGGAQALQLCAAQQHWVSVRVLWL